MSSTSASYDVLKITIDVDSGNANRNISKLSTNLQKLNDKAKELDDKRLIEVKGLLQDIANIDFTNVVKGLDSVVKAFQALSNKAFKNQTKNGTDLSGVIQKPDFNVLDQNKIADLTKGLDFSPAQRNLQLVTKAIDDYKASLKALSGTIDTTAKKEETLEDKLSSVGLTADQVKQVFSAFNKPIPLDASQLDAVRQALLEFGIEAEDVERTIANLRAQLGIKDKSELETELENIGLSGEQVKTILGAVGNEAKKIDPSQIKALEKALKKVGYSGKQVKKIIAQVYKEGNKKTGSGLSNLAKHFKTILRQRVLRKIIQGIYQAITDGLKNVAEFDEKTKASLEDIKKSYSAFKNSIGSVLAPLIQMVTPFITMVLGFLTEANNSLAEMFAGLNGQTQFAKAKEDLEDFNDEAKKTQALGIDELNVFQQEDNNGFEMADVDTSKYSALTDTFGELKETFTKIFGYAKQFVSTILPKISALLTPIMDIVGDILDLVTMLIDDTADGVNESLYAVVDCVGEILKSVSMIVRDLMPALTPIIKIVGTIINVINNSITSIASGLTLITQIAETLHPLFKVLAVAVGFILSCVETIFLFIEALIKTINDIATFNWGHIGENWAEMGEKVRQAWEEYGKAVNTETRSYATGGFPEDGFFYANHSELVGQFSNGQTAVANNEQIIEGIKQGVMEALRESGGGQQDIVINLDGYELARVVTKKQNNFGADLVGGGNIIFGK